MNKKNGFQQIIFIVPRAYSNIGGGPAGRILGPGDLDSVPPTDV
jgi:hypothetical protein